MDVNPHYAALLGLGDEWTVTDVALDVLGKRVDVYVDYVKKSANMLKKNLHGLLAWFGCMIDNALTEGFNSTIQSLKVSARGYRNFENFRTVILFFCGKLDLRPDFVRIGSTI